MHLSFGLNTAIVVPVFAYKPSSLDFRGVYENTEIYTRNLKFSGKTRNK